MKKYYCRKDTKTQNSMEQGAWRMAYISYLKGAPPGPSCLSG
jgi:hypothetical protein